MVYWLQIHGYLKLRIWSETGLSDYDGDVVGLAARASAARVGAGVYSEGAHVLFVFGEPVGFITQALSCCLWTLNPKRAISLLLDLIDQTRLHILLKDIIKESIRAHNHDIPRLQLMLGRIRIMGQFAVSPALVWLVKPPLLLLGSEYKFHIILRTGSPNHISRVAQIACFHHQVLLV